jgi:hypothetical protein
MLTPAPSFRFSLDPLIAEAKQRMRRRRLLVAAVLVLVGAAAAAGVLAARSPVDTNAKVAGLSRPTGTRWCGYLGLGIGWRVGASSTMSCRSGRTFMREYVRADKGPAPTRFRGYACTFRVLPSEVGSFDCASGNTRVIAVSNH